MTNRFQNPELYKHLKAATMKTSDLIKSLVNKLQVVPTQKKVDRKLRKDITTELSAIAEETIPNEPSFKSCVECLVKDVDINEIIEELVRELMQKSTKEDLEMKEEEVRELLQKVSKRDDVEINEIIEEDEDARGNLQSLQKSIKDKVNGKAEFIVWNRIGEYLNCPYLINWDEFWDDFREFNEQTFDEYYTEYEQFLYSNLPVKYQIVVTLENFENILPSSDITLSGNTKIVSCKHKHSASITENNETLPLPKGMTAEWPNVKEGPTKFLLEIDYEIEKGKVPFECREHIEHISQEEVKKAFHILRLYKEGDFRYGIMYWCPKTPCDPPYDTGFDLFYSDEYHTSNKYRLQKDDVNELQLLFQKYTNNSNKKGFPHSAINYLDKGVRETDTPHRLVDYTAALESLFVEGKEGIATMLALRTAFFLEEDRQKCREIFKDIKKAYGFRSNIVHGNFHKIKDELELEKYCNTTERYVRLTIIKWIDMIEKGKTFQEIYDYIEDKLFSL